MSTSTPSLARSRSPRSAVAGSVRSRLALVPPVRSRARRTPFVVLVVGVLVGGVVGLLLFNTQMQQGSFQTSALQQEATSLAATQQTLNMELQQLRDPQNLAVRAAALGMVVPPDPAFLRLSDGRVLGTPTATTSQDRMRVRGYPAAKPADLAPAPRIVRVTAPPTPAPASAADSSTASGPASHGTAAAQGRKGAQASSSTARSTSRH
ncbi:MAG: hypothetical protein ACTHJH_01480 [Marmoricola sp.]